METDISDVRAAILIAYRSLETPNFAFVGKQMDSRPYDRLIETLSGNYHLTEDTEPNYDVSFTFYVRTNDGSWLLQLSMVGPFACLVRFSKAGRPGEVLSDLSKDLTREEIELKTVLSRFGIRLMTRCEMEQPIRLQMHLAEIDETRIYHALFCDDYYLPWKGREQ